MLGKITRWLRMLGHDVNYFRSTDDKKLVELAKKEKRVLLTRDRELVKRAKGLGAEAVLVEASELADTLAFLARRFGFKLEIDLRVSRCPICNGRIVLVPKEKVANDIPKATSKHYEEFWRCTRCGKVYWQGAHWKKIEKTIEEAQSKLNQT